MAKVPNGVENFNRLSRAHKRYRQTTTTEGRATAYSELNYEMNQLKDRLNNTNLLAKLTFEKQCRGLLTRQLLS